MFRGRSVCDIHSHSPPMIAYTRLHDTTYMNQNLKNETFFIKNNNNK